MKVFFDTSVLVASVISQHQSHVKAYAALDRVQTGKDEGVVAAHSLAEMYSILTKAPPPLRHAPEQALLSIEENVLKYFKVIALSASDYRELIREAAILGIQGGTIYDAILIKCAGNTESSQILTLNLKHFQNVAPKNLVPRITAP
jgi:predicted nucleic acid-binding protein